MFRPLKSSRLFGDSRGLSLIELLVAVSIVSILGLSIFTIFSQGLKLWSRASSVVPDVDSDIVFERLTSDLSDTYASQMGEFEGADTMMKFYGFSRMNYQAQKGEVQIKHPKVIHYFFAPEGKILARSEESLEVLLSKDPKSRQIPYKTVMRGVKECRFEYYHKEEKKEEFQWKPYWNSKCLPKAVRISLKYDDERRVQNFVKIIPLPATSCVN